MGEQTNVLTVELAKTGRSKCRGCYEPIEKGAVRVGMQERLPNTVHCQATWIAFRACCSSSCMLAAKRSVGVVRSGVDNGEAVHDMVAPAVLRALSNPPAHGLTFPSFPLCYM